MAYIYQITNDINGKIYIGKTEYSIEKRFKEHCRDSLRDTVNKRPLYSAMHKYGIEHFHISLLEETSIPEEREVYWIEQKQSFRNGYNATLGGDGKHYIDYDLVISTYQEIGIIKETAQKLNISADSVSKILHSHNVQINTTQEMNIQKYGKTINMYSLDGEYLRSFVSTNQAAKYMVENNLTNCKLTTIKQHIKEVCVGSRKTAAKYIWKYSENE